MRASLVLTKCASGCFTQGSSGLSLMTADKPRIKNGNHNAKYFSALGMRMTHQAAV